MTGRHRRAGWKTWTFLCLLLLIAGMALAAHALTSQRIGALASKRLGRTLSVEGPLHIGWSLRAPLIHAQDVRIANTEGADEAEMARIGDLDFTFRLWPLLRGRLELPFLRISRAHVLLERRDAEHANWDFPALSAANAAKNAALPSERGDMPVIDNLEIEDSEVLYRDRPKDLELSVKVGKAEGADAARRFSFTGNGSLAKKKFTVAAQGGSLEMLRDTDRDFPLAFSLDFGGTHIMMDGTFRDPIKMKGLKAQVRAEGPNLADIFYVTRVPLPPTPPYKIEGMLEKNAAVWSFRDFKGEIGGSDVAGNITKDMGRRQALTSGAIRSRHMDIADLGGFIGLAPPPRELAEASPKQKALARRESASPFLLPDTPLDVKRLRASDLDLTLDAERLEAQGWPLNDMHARFRLESGMLRVDPLKFGVAGGTIEGFVAVDGSKDTPSARTSLDLKHLQLRPFFADSRFDGLSKGRFGGAVQLAGDGASLADILGDSRGRIVIVMAGGTISLLLVNEINLDIAKSLPALIFGNDKKTDIRCALGDFAVENGRLRSNTFIFDTTASNLRGDVALNLKDEALDASIDAHPKDPSLLALQSRIIATGTLKDPAITIDPLTTGLRAAAAAALGAIAPPVALLPFVELGLGKDTDCNSLLAAVEPAAG